MDGAVAAPRELRRRVRPPSQDVPSCRARGLVRGWCRASRERPGRTARCPRAGIAGGDRAPSAGPCRPGPARRRSPCARVTRRLPRPVSCGSGCIGDATSNCDGRSSRAYGARLGRLAADGAGLHAGAGSVRYLDAKAELLQHGASRIERMAFDRRHGHAARGHPDRDASASTNGLTGWHRLSGDGARRMLCREDRFGNQRQAELSDRRLLPCGLEGEANQVRHGRSRRRHTGAG